MACSYRSKVNDFYDPVNFHAIRRRHAAMMIRVPMVIRTILPWPKRTSWRKPPRDQQKNQ